jgi:hypothetical protein
MATLDALVMSTAQTAIGASSLRLRRSERELGLG